MVQLGVYTAVLHDRPLPDALDVIAGLGLQGAEVGSGGFLPPVHIPVDDVLASRSARDDYLGVFAEHGVALAGLNCNGNPLHPDPAIGEEHAEDLRRSIRAAGALGQTRVVTMSGLPGGEPGARVPNWVVNAWSSGALDVLDHQWDIAVRFWKDIDRLAADHGVEVAIELHPQNLVFNPPTLQRLVERTGATHLGCEMDASHLFWQQMDPVAAVEHLGDLVLQAAAKDVRINARNARIVGVLDERFRRRGPEEDRVNIGGDEWVNEWPADSAWDFVAVGRGHDAGYWARFLAACHAVDPDMAVNIEHEDTSLGRIEGLQVAAATLTRARKEAGV
jgi:sugar phosphate isomerase/epimerase